MSTNSKPYRLKIPRTLQGITALSYRKEKELSLLTKDFLDLLEIEDPSQEDINNISSSLTSMQLLHSEIKTLNREYKSLCISKFVKL